MSHLRPNRRKDRVPDMAYMGFVAEFPCVVCRKRGVKQKTITEVAHVGDTGRGLGAKCDDRETLPICGEHHRAGPDSHHVLGKGFWKAHGLNRDELVKELQDAYDRMEEWPRIGVPLVEEG